MPRKRLYILILMCSIAGNLWLAGNLYTHRNEQMPDVCLFRRVTGLPCPSCGTTRSVMYITKLQWGNALHANPIGFIVAICMFLFPLWIIYDIARRKNSFHNFYISAEIFLRRKPAALLLVLLVLANWVWNIYKFPL